MIQITAYAKMPTSIQPMINSGVLSVPKAMRSIKAIGAENGKKVKNCTKKFGSAAKKELMKYSGNTKPMMIGPINCEASFAVGVIVPI